MADIDISVGQKVTLSVVPTTSNLDAELVEPPKWTAADTSIIYLAPSDDGRSCVVTGKSIGSSDVTVSATGASTLTATDTIIVTAATSNLATALDLSAEQID